MKTTFTLLGTLLCLFSFAQIQKGTRMVGTSIGGLNFVWAGNDGNLNLSLNPSLLKFTSNRFAWGGGVSAHVSTSGDPLAFSLGVSPTVRFYNKSEKSDRMYLQLSAGGGSLISGDPIFYATYGAAVGYNRFFAQNVAFDLGFGYTGFTSQSTTNMVGFNLGIQIFLPPKHR